jgi:CheY-like chemotaxis protein
MAIPKLLVVDKNLTDLGSMTQLFTSLKTNVCPINDDHRAAALIDQEQFDGIFLDVEYSRHDGLELANLARQSSRNKQTPIVVVTGHDQDDTIYQSFCKGATFFLTKPINKPDLAELIQTMQNTFRDERRRYNRVALETPVTCRVANRTLSGNACNISQGGMQLEVHGLQLGEAVHLSFRLPAAIPSIEATGVIAWAKDDRQGVHFTSMGVEHQQMIRAFIAQPELSPK